MTCQRIWEAEAIEDRRLDERSVTSFERHAGTCSDCTRSLERLRALGQFRERVEPRRLSPLEHRRSRAELLRRANAEALRPRRGPLLPLLSLAATIVALGFVGYRLERGTVAAARLGTGGHARVQPKFELRSIGNAVFHDESSGAAARVVLVTGTLAVHVERLLPGQRFVVGLPDGELEVHGTRFIVEARQGRTDRVLVTEGVVALRLSGTPARSLRAGESYSAGDVDSSKEPSLVGEPKAAATSNPLDPTTAMANSSGVPRVRRAASIGVQEGAGRGGTSAFAAGRHGGAAPATPDEDGRTGGLDSEEARSLPPERDPNGGPRAGGAAAPSEAPGIAFHTAMAAFSTGAYVEADERFAEFIGRFGGDSRCEDAVFLRTVIALRRGDPAAAVERARSYLRRFPDGLRRSEMEKMVESAKTSGNESLSMAR